jgi:hypothetical protein
MSGPQADPVDTADLRQGIEENVQRFDESATIILERM